MFLKPFKATRQYSPTIKYCLKPFQFVLNSKHLPYVRLWAHINHCFVRKENCVLSHVTYDAYLQIWKRADNLIFLIKICHEIKQMLKFCNSASLQLITLKISLYLFCFSLFSCEVWPESRHHKSDSCGGVFKNI